MLFLYRMVKRKVMAELFRYTEEGANGHVLGPFSRVACGRESVPGGAEVVVEHVHVFGHVVVLFEFAVGEFGPDFFFFCGWFDDFGGGFLALRLCVCRTLGCDVHDV